MGNIGVSIPGEHVFYYVKSGHVSEIAISDAPEKPVHAFSFSIIHFVGRPARQFFGKIESTRRDLMNVTGSYRRGNETLETKLW